MAAIELLLSERVGDRRLVTALIGGCQDIYKLRCKWYQGQEAERSETYKLYEPLRHIDCSPLLQNYYGQEKTGSELPPIFRAHEASLAHHVRLPNAGVANQLD